MDDIEVMVSAAEGVELDAEYAGLIETVVRLGAREGGVTAGEVSVLVTDDEGIRRLNRRFRAADKATDVLSFPLGGECLGDIVISLPRAREQAADYGHSLRREVAFLAAHGTLHLLGYDHETNEEDAAEMERKQDELLNKLEIPR